VLTAAESRNVRACRDVCHAGGVRARALAEDDDAVTVSMLSERDRAFLDSRPFTYPDVGATRTALPAGYHQLTETVALRPGADFDHAVRLLMSWQVQARAGLDVKASALTVSEGAVVAMRLGYGPVGLSIPCRVVYIIDEPDRHGFAYGTLPGHPESGEELFLLERGNDGSTSFTISAFSRPATALTRLGGPIARTVQRAMTGRYLRAIHGR
jgi:uncharacterized protein (UPF0548 family)